LGRQFNRAYGITPAVDYLAWVAPSWYPPTGNNGAQSRMQPVEDDEVHPSSPPASTENATEYDHSLIDVYGWVQLGNGLYYNIETKITQDTHPFVY
jgi:hypothetical protein